MPRLEKSLKEWLSHGFISEAQADLIRNHERTKPESSWVLSGLLTLGAIIIGIGIISLIAANWIEIPNAIKLGGDFVILAGLAWLTLCSWESQKLIQFDVLLLFFIVFCLASIGLISQVFHSDGKLYQALMFWSFITLPAAAMARKWLVPFFWLGAFLAAIACTALDSPVLEPIFHQSLSAVSMATTLLCATFTVLSENMASDFSLTRAFRRWTLIQIPLALLISESMWRSYTRPTETNFVTSHVPGYLFAVFAIIGIWQSKKYRTLQKLLLISTIAMFLVPFHFPLLEARPALAYATTTILVLGLLAVFLASQKERKLFQWILFFMAVRFLVLYFQALGGLATTGGGLILSGGLIIGLTIIWNKYKTQVAIWTERWTQ